MLHRFATLASFFAVKKAACTSTMTWTTVRGAHPRRNIRRHRAMGRKHCWNPRAWFEGYGIRSLLASASVQKKSKPRIGRGPFHIRSFTITMHTKDFLSLVVSSAHTLVPAPAPAGIRQHLPAAAVAARLTGGGLPSAATAAAAAAPAPDSEANDYEVRLCMFFAWWSS